MRLVGHFLTLASLLDPRQRDVFFKIVAFVGKIASGIYGSGIGRVTVSISRINVTGSILVSTAMERASPLPPRRLSAMDAS